MTKRAFSFTATIALLALVGCGRVGALQPTEGEPLPVKPLMARSTPTAEQLLAPPPYADPDRVDELMKESTPRATDRFDLPPPSGAAPEVPVQAQDEDTINQLGPVTPE